ncbi:MAG: cyclase dehydrase [Longimicrobiales bacterium]
MDGQSHRQRPRSFYPHFIDDPPPQHGAPGWDMGPERRIDDGRTMARALAWLSVGLGAFEIVGARALTRFLGVDERHTTRIRLYGVREVLTGISIMKQRTPALSMWSRVAGDAVDLATLGMAFRRDDPRPRAVALAALAVAGAAALDITSAFQLTRTQAQIRRHSGAAGNGRFGLARTPRPRSSDQGFVR